MLTRSHANLKDKIEHPANYYKSPDEIANDSELSPEQRERALDTWEQDARQMLTASNEGMAGSKEGITRDDRSRFGEVARAKVKIRQKAKAQAVAMSSEASASTSAPALNDRYWRHSGHWWRGNASRARVDITPPACGCALGAHQAPAAAPEGGGAAAIALSS